MFDRVQEGGNAMRFRQNLGAISKLTLIFLLLVATIAGAFLSYLWVEGYYFSLGLRNPEKNSIAITNASFPIQNTSFFNVTVLNPSFSASEAKVTQIRTLTKDGVANNVALVEPKLPYQILRSKSENFRCDWNWANYTGEDVTIMALTAEGTGAVFLAKAPLVNLTITNVRFAPRFEKINMTHFNMTIQNSELSATNVNITEIRAAWEVVEEKNATLPYTLDRGAKVAITCTWNWTGYQRENMTIGVHTSQGYAAYHTEVLPSPIIPLTITEVIFNVTDTNHFNVTVKNFELSYIPVDITGISITKEDGPIEHIPGDEVDPPLFPSSYTLPPNTSATFTCTYNWTDYRSKNVTVTVYAEHQETRVRYSITHTETTPASLGSLSTPFVTTVYPIVILSMNWVKFFSGWKGVEVKRNLVRKNIFDGSLAEG